MADPGFPPGPPPPPVRANPNEDNGPTVVIAIWSLFLLAGIFLSLRLYCKLSRRAGLWWDDHLLIASWLALLVDQIFITRMTTLGYGKHYERVPLDNAKQMALLGMTSSIFIIMAIAWSKTSFALTILRISSGWVKYLVWFIIISMNIFLGLSPLLHWVGCRPLRRAWDFTSAGTCLDPVAMVKYDIFCSGYSAAMDFILALLPTVLIRGLQMKKREKVGLVIAMSCGVFAGATAVVKCFYLHTLLDIDFSFSGAQLSIWGSAEVATTIVAASIPVLRALIREIAASVENYYSQGTYGDSATRKSKIRHGNNTLVEADPERTPTNYHRSDGDSAKSILVHGKIIQTSEVAIVYHNRSEEDATYEMGRIRP